MAKLIEITGKVLSGEWGTDDESGNGIPVLRTTNFTNEGIVDYSNVVTRTIQKKNIDAKYLRKGDIIIEKSGGSDKQPVGRVIYFDGPESTYLFNNFTGLLRVKNQAVWLPRYVFYSLFHNYRKGGTRPFESKTTGLHNLKTDDYISRYEVLEAPISEQQSICKQLDYVYDIIKTRQQQLQKLEELIKARFVELFGDPLSNSKGWPEYLLTDVCSAIFGGGTPSKSHPEYFTGSIPWVSPKDMKMPIISDSIDHITDEAVAHSTTNFVPENSVLMVIRSGVLKHTLPVAINNIPVTINQDMKAFVPNSLVTPTFLMYYFKAIESDVLSGVRGVTADNIDFKSFQKRFLIVPPISVQEKFSSFVEQVNKSKVAVQKSLDEAQLLFDSLMQQYFD